MEKQAYDQEFAAKLECRPLFHFCRLPLFEAAGEDYSKFEVFIVAIMGFYVDENRFKMIQGKEF